MDDILVVDEDLVDINCDGNRQSDNKKGKHSSGSRMAKGEKKKEEKKHLQDESIFCKKEEVDTFGYSKLDHMPEYEDFSIAKIFAEIIHSIQSLFTQK